MFGPIAAAGVGLVINLSSLPHSSLCVEVFIFNGDMVFLVCGMIAVFSLAAVLVGEVGLFVLVGVVPAVVDGVV